MTITGERPANQAARRAMIDSQLRTSGVNQPWVLAAMGAIAREDYVPEAMRSAAYIDRAIPLGDGRFLASPVVHAKMLAEAVPTPADQALLVGDAKGYLAALLTPLVGSLTVIDPGAEAWADDVSADMGSFSLVIIDGAIEQLPSRIVRQLNEGGRIVTGLVERGVTRFATGRKTAGEVVLLPLSEIGMPVLAQFAAPKRWSF